ncbi:hypothetical protein [Streptomyces sp. NPDC088360]|uniref:hypothetical protein n=1 Tax=Streptomyces sp. NPDC088360 TaxID=3154515 RepID=UPI0034502B38
MAKELRPTTICDWHSALPAPTSVAGTSVRTLDNGKEVDLCESCAWVFDFYYPRREQILALLQPGVLDTFYRSARNPESTRRVPAQLTLTADEKPPPIERPQATQKPRKSTKKNVEKRSTNGVWKEDEVQIVCPLPHRDGSPSTYWVDLRNRTGHAHSHKKDDGTNYDGPDIAFVLQDDQKFAHFCTQHQICAEHGGYGFLTATSLNAHLNKARGWTPATPEAKDAAETRLQKQAA